MQNFVFHNPTKIIFGQGTIGQIGPETAALASKILLVYGKKSIVENGIYATAVKSLWDAGLSIVEHGGVSSNPLLSHVRQGVQLAKENKVDGIVAIGGGSVIDSAKAINAGSQVDHDVWQFFKGKKSIKKVLPLTTILTLAASGSEMNSGMVITNEDKKQKFGTGNNILHPRVSILDPTATFSVPADYTAFGAVDAIAHILEFYFTTADHSVPVQDRFMEGLVTNVMESCDCVLSNLKDYQGRADLMWCATLALNGLTGAGLGKVGFPMHMIEHSLSALYNIPHGAGLAVIMPAWMTWQTQKNPAKFSQFARRVFGHNQKDNSSNALAGITSLKQWFTSIRCPVTLNDLGIDSTDIPAIAENSLSLGKIWRLREYSQEIIEDILHIACKS